MGYMGSGKSSIALQLATFLKMKPLDLDLYIENKEGSSISKLFKTKGEIYFRKKEQLYLKEVLKTPEYKIISVGGGTPCYANNLELIQNSLNTTSVYLSTTVETLTNRLWNEKNNRPLISHINTKAALNDFIRKHIFERSFYYNQAQYTIQTDDKSISEVVLEIQNKLL